MLKAIVQTLWLWLWVLIQFAHGVRSWFVKTPPRADAPLPPPPPPPTRMATDSWHDQPSGREVMAKRAAKARRSRRGPYAKRKKPKAH